MLATEETNFISYQCSESQRWQISLFAGSLTGFFTLYLAVCLLSFVCFNFLQAPSLCTLQVPSLVSPLYTWLILSYLILSYLCRFPQRFLHFARGRIFNSVNSVDSVNSVNIVDSVDSVNGVNSVKSVSLQAPSLVSPLYTWQDARCDTTFLNR